MTYTEQLEAWRDGGKKRGVSIQLARSPQKRVDCQLWLGRERIALGTAKTIEEAARNALERVQITPTATPPDAPIAEPPPDYIEVYDRSQSTIATPDDPNHQPPANADPGVI